MGKKHFCAEALDFAQFLVSICQFTASIPFPKSHKESSQNMCIYIYTHAYLYTYIYIHVYLVIHTHFSRYTHSAYVYIYA